jgi:hypothetical protein
VASKVNIHLFCTVVILVNAGFEELTLASTTNLREIKAATLFVTI